MMGFIVGLNANNATFSHTVQRETGTNTSPSITTRTEESELGLEANVGYQFHLNDTVYLAGEVFYNNHDIETLNLNNLLRTQLTLNSSYGAKIKLGFDVNDKFSVYALVGHTTLDFDIRNSYPFAPSVRTGDASEGEFTMGVGAQYSLSDNFAFTAEYSQLNDLSFDPIPEVAVAGKINDNEVDLSSLSFGIKYSF